MKQLVSEKQITITPFAPDREQSLDSFLQEITETISTLKAEHYTSETVKDALYARTYGYDGAFEIDVVFYREETDEEEQRREEEEREYQERMERKRLTKLEKTREKTAAKEMQEREEYERLKAKYG